ncbi:MAG TPA: hypothetical protein VEH26_04020, partial [Chthoniobacterales bacterium]|nr:hypothetical protein [Chthoniobacterales bacterium]
MAALLYLALSCALGDQLCRRFWIPKSIFYRWAAAFLIGTLVSAWATYLAALTFRSAAQPLVWGNLIYFLAAGFAYVVLARRDRTLATSKMPNLTRPEIVFLLAFVPIAGWLMFGTLAMHGGDVRLSSAVWNDFGPNLALMQSFAVGHNFPTEYPYFIGEPIRYHFLFWFAAGNLEFLGLNPAWALNLLSTLSMIALLVSIMTLGFVLFESWIVGGIAALLLFFSGTLAFIPFFRSQRGIISGLAATLHLNHWLSSGFPFPGENWGIWSISILYVQRHFLGAIGILCLVLTFLVDHCKQRAECVPPSRKLVTERVGASYSSFIFSGALIGLLPLWNSPVFLSALAILGLQFVLFRDRKRIGLLFVVAVAVGLPQILFLGLAQTAQRFSMLRWGFTIEHPTIPAVLSYFLFTFGPKLALSLIALVFLSKSHRLLFAAISILVLLAFGTRLSVEVMNNQKFLYLWLILLNLFVAYALVRLFQFGWSGKITAMIFAVLITATGFIEFFRVHNDNWVDVPFRDNHLSDWLLRNTKPSDVFLGDRYVHHPLLMNGRRIFYGWPYFAWSMGYDTGERDAVYASILKEENPDRLLELLKQNGINYVAIDNGFRQSKWNVGPHEAAFAANCTK